ncbi:MAG: aminotransferase class III-fold pyridoxal phosphate-dependent enzyme [Proteobacteria bacterium]|nr:aminotransferase class III-fold pyridoxal phosphate-dependent enzyme [Pseudomonadota bacterium]
MAFPGNSTSLVDLARWRAARDAGRLAFAFLDDNAPDGIREKMTYARLDREARAIATLLRQRGARPGDHVLILYPPGLDYIAAFFGCLYGGLVAVPAYPPDPRRLAKTLPRLQAIADDCEARFALSTPQIGTLLRAVSAVDICRKLPVVGASLGRLAARWQMPEVRIRGVRHMSPQNLSQRMADRFRPVHIDMETLAFLQYTSGSTGTPKGVMVTHGNLLFNQEMIKRATSSERDTCIVGWAPLYHDMGIIGNVLHALYLGIPSYLMSPMAFLQKPVRWLKAIAERGGTFSGGPNFAYDLCVKKITDEEAQGLDLSRWEFAFTGSEPVRASTIEAFSARFARHSFRRQAFYPCYGMADATLLVSAGARNRLSTKLTVSKSALKRNRAAPAGDDGDATTLVSSGEACFLTAIAIVNPATGTRVAPGEIGEIWVTGPHVARGYWNRPEQTRAAYNASLPDDDRAFLRTGDLGFMHAGELFVTGRIKDVIIIRGRNLYAHDIEAAIQARRDQAPELRPGCGIAIGVNTDAGEALVVVQEVAPDKAIGFDPAHTVRIIRRVILDEFGVAPYEVVLIPRGTIPKTSSGKLRRPACKRLYLSDFEGWSEPPLHRDRRPRDHSAAPEPDARVASLRSSGDVRAWLIAQLAHILDRPRTDIDSRQALPDLGLDSLTATQLAAAIQEHVGIELAYADMLLEDATLDRMAELLAKRISGSRTGASEKPRPHNPIAARPPSAQPEPPRDGAPFQARKQTRIHQRPQLAPADSHFARYVNPFLGSLLADTGLDRQFVRAKGCRLFDSDGVEYLDFIAQYGALPFGYNPPEIWQALAGVQERGEPSFAQPSLLDAAGELARRLLCHAPGMTYVTYANSGAEAVEAAIKLCRSATGRRTILSTENGFHGKTLGALSATGRPSYQNDFGAPAAGFSTIPFGDLDALERALTDGPLAGDIAAFIVEPIQGEAGIVVPPAGYLRDASALCRYHGVLFIADEVQTGLGRTGAMFASLDDGAEPDVIVLAKALGGGLMPIGAIMCRAELYNRDFALKHSSTFAGNSLACRAGIAVLDRLERDNGALLIQVRENSAYLRTSLDQLVRSYPEVFAAVQGRGYLLGLRLSLDSPLWADSVLARLADQGMFGWLLCSHLLHREHIRLAPTLNGSDVLRIEPPLIASRAHCDQLVAALGRMCERLVSGRSAALVAHLVDGPAESPRAIVAASPTRPDIAPGRDTRRFAFLLHPIDAGSLAHMDPDLTGFTVEQLADIQQRMHRQADPFQIGETTVVSKVGDVVYGRFIALPHTAQQLGQMSPRLALESIEEALAVAAEDEPDVIGLGAFTSVVTHGGLSLPRETLPVLTSGSAFTALSGQIAVRRAMARQGIVPAHSTVAVVGASGHVGSAVSLLMTEDAGRLVAIGNTARADGAHTRLRRTLQAAISAILEDTPESTTGPSGTLRHRILTRRDLRPDMILADLLADGHIQLTTQLTRDHRPDVVITATSDTRPFLDQLDGGITRVICDLSRPRNIAPQLAGRTDIDYVAGGVIALPEGSTLGFSSDLPTGQAYACMAETILLALDPAARTPPLTPGTPLHILESFCRLAQIHGFQVV